MLSICVNSQSSPIRMLRQIHPSDGDASSMIGIDELEYGVDYMRNTGGVTRMTDPMLRMGVENGCFSSVDWVALSGNFDYIIENGYVLHGISIPKPMLKSYISYKEAIWERMHGRKADYTPSGLRAYMRYNQKISREILELNSERGFDLVYVHDFQQLPQGRLLGDFSPQLFRWHIPLCAQLCDDVMQDLLLSYLSRFTAVAVSTNRYEAELRGIGFEGNIIQRYPYIDDRALRTHEGHELVEFRERWNLSADDPLIICVARRTPSKNQGVLIRAMRPLVRRFPRAKLMLIGNGSFSNSPSGGLGLSKSERWGRHLEYLVVSNGLQDNVIMTGYMSEEDIQMAYQTSDLLVLPSLLEGFGLVAIEAWWYSKPVVISEGAGVAERVTEGENGYVFDPRRPKELSDKILRILSDRELAEQMGANGRTLATEHGLEEWLKSELSLMEEVIDLWQAQKTAEGFGDLAET